MPRTQPSPYLYLIKKENTTFDAQQNTTVDAQEKKPLSVVKRLDDIERNLLSLRSPQGYVINAGLNNNFFFYKMLQELQPPIRAYDPIPESFREQVTALTPEQRKDLIAKIKIYNCSRQSQRFIDYCVSQGLSNDEIAPRKEENGSEKDSIENLIKSAQESTYQPRGQEATNVLLQLLKRRALGENLQTRLAGIIEHPDNNEVRKQLSKHLSKKSEQLSEKDPVTIADVALYYDRIADFCTILLGNKKDYTSEDDMNKIQQILSYFSTSRPVEQSFFVQTPLEGFLPVYDLMPKQLLLSFNDEGALHLKMKYSQIGLRNLTDMMSYFFYKNKPLKLSDEKTPEKIKTFADKLSRVEATAAQTICQYDKWEENFANEIEKHSRDHSVSIALTHEITAVWGEKNGVDCFNALSDKVIIPEALVKLADPKLFSELSAQATNNNDNHATVVRFQAAGPEIPPKKSTNLWGLFKSMLGLKRTYCSISESVKNNMLK